MWIWLLLAVLLTVGNVSPNEDLSPKAEKYRQRYTLLADSKNKDNNDILMPEKGVTPQQQPWRRLASYNIPWPLTSLFALPIAAVLPRLLGPGLLLVGINLGASLYMVLCLFGLSLNGNLNDFYRHSLVDGGGKDMADIYL